MLKITLLTYNEGAKSTKLHEKTTYPELSRQLKQNRTNVLQTIVYTSCERKKNLNVAVTLRENF